MAPHKLLALKISSMRYLKEGVSEEQFHDWASNVHAPKAANVQARHGALRITQFHTPTATRNLIAQKMPAAIRPGWKIDDHDIVISFYVRTLEDFFKIVTDPEFQELYGGESEVVALDKGTMTIGWEEVYVEDGKVVNVVDGRSAYPTFAESSNLGQD
ncbi:EthD domain-containing protein [Dendryphion nanum]|uniref:EthD domain-containing protein n=1 Tax=Dendryphion nanum TaxID=256645 RepID=A0A9P9DUS7_9PLEO|nr:EthD domain-containing protein [Dendryphion nanum]